MTLSFQTSCETYKYDSVINFVGDSIVARWDINQDFPSYCVYNFGVGGSGLKLLESYTSKFIGQNVVVICGTNDNNMLKADKREEYAEKYISAILALTNQRIYLFSILPRDFEGDRTDINTDINEFNAIISDRVLDINQITYIDVFHDFMKEEQINQLYYSDGLHPNSIGYEILTQKLLKVL